MESYKIPSKDMSLSVGGLQCFIYEAFGCLLNLPQSLQGSRQLNSITPPPICKPIIVHPILGNNDYYCSLKNEFKLLQRKELSRLFLLKGSM